MDNQEIQEKYRSIMGKLMAVLRDHKSAVDSFVSDTKLHKSQHRLLMNLSRMGSKVSQRDLAERLNITPAAVAVTLKKLEKNDIISKTTSETDNRYNQIEMTPKGKEIVKESKKVFNQIDEKMFQGFSETELLQLEEYINRMHQNITK